MKAKGVLEKKDKTTPESNITRTIIIFLLGLVLVLIPSTLNKLIGILGGLTLLLFGVTSIFQYLQNKIGNTINLATGILYSVLGAFIMVYPHSVINLVAKCIGLYLIINGIIKMQLAFSLKDNPKWTVTLVISILIMVLGALLIFNPFSGIAITKITGIFMVAMVIFDVVDTYFIQK